MRPSKSIQALIASPVSIGTPLASATIILCLHYGAASSLVSLLVSYKSAFAEKAARGSFLKCESDPGTALLNALEWPQRRAKDLTGPCLLMLPPCPSHSGLLAVLEHGSSFLPQGLCTGHTFSIYWLGSSPHLLCLWLTSPFSEAHPDHFMKNGFLLISIPFSHLGFLFP